MLFEQHLPKKKRLLADIRTNAVIKFCQAVKSTQAAMEEKTLTWDQHMEAHQRWLDVQQQQQQLEATSAVMKEAVTKGSKRKWGPSHHDDGEKRVYMCKYPPKGERPAMKARQVKPPDRNRPRHSFSVDAKTTNKNNPYSARWDSDDGTVTFMKQKIALWGCPSKRRRELERLTARMPDGERAA